jgi:hypothetical protein
LTKHLKRSIILFKVDEVSEYLERTSYSTGDYSLEELNVNVDKEVDLWYQTDLFDEFGTTEIYN